MNKVDICYGIVLISLACCSFRCTLLLYLQCVYVHSETVAQSEPVGNKHQKSRTTEQPNSRTAEQPNSRTTEQPNSRTAEQPHIVPSRDLLTCISPFFLTFRDHLHIFVGQSSPSFSSTVCFQSCQLSDLLTCIISCIV